MFIEDLVLLVNDNHLDYSKIPSKDISLIVNVSKQLRNNVLMTKGQADLLVKILTENQHRINIPSLGQSLESPQFKFNFRQLDMTRKIFLYGNDRKSIAIKYPFNNKLNNLLNSISRTEFDKKEKAYIVSLTQQNIFTIVEKFSSHDFVIDPEIIGWYEQIKEIKNNSELYVPTVEFDNELVLKNANQNLTRYYNDNKSDSLLPNLFLAKSLGITISDTVRLEVEKENPNDITKHLIYSEKSKFFISPKTASVSNIIGSLKETNAWPLLVITDDNNLSTIENWYIDLINNGVSEKEISVMFRSNTNKEMNTFIRSKNLNNLVDETTKVVFIKQKVSKVLLKIGFKPKVILGTSRYYAHFSAQKMVDSHPVVLYYTDQVSSLDHISVDM